MSEYTLRFEIPGKVVPKARARVTRSGITYTPRSTRTYETDVAGAALKAMRTFAPLKGAVSLGIQIICGVPQSWTKAQTAAALAGDVFPMSSGDLDNKIKAISDGMNGIVYVDDKQIVRLHVITSYGPEAKAIVTIGAVSNASELGDL